MTQERKKITSLPTQWPSRGMIRADVGEYIVLDHPERKPHLSTDGKRWVEADLRDPEHNKIVALYERRRLAK